MTLVALLTASAVFVPFTRVAPPLNLLDGHRRECSIRAGLFDMFKESEESKRAKEEAFRTQQEMLRRRRDPNAMDEYFEEVESRRSETMAAGAELKAVQAGQRGDALEAWKELKEQGLVKGMDETERDADSSRMGSEGLIAERIDEKLPYIDSGYVAEDTPDVMGELGKAFGKLMGGDKK